MRTEQNGRAGVGAPVAWFEITGQDPKALADFYRELFGWSVGDSGDASYLLIDTGAGGEAIGGGIGQAQDPAGGVTVYMKVGDLQAHLDEAERLGGKTVLSPTDLPGDFGKFAVFTDPEGHVVGLWS
jgi:predicted enzyme related to lactoylglutathione lyase